MIIIILDQIQIQRRDAHFGFVMCLMGQPANIQQNIKQNADSARQKPQIGHLLLPLLLHLLLFVTAPNGSNRLRQNILKVATTTTTVSN